jgi:hypothetical protein
LTVRPTAAVRAKQLGAKSLRSVSEIIGRANTKNSSLLYEWNKRYPDLFDAVVLGSIELQKLKNK